MADIIQIDQLKLERSRRPGFCQHKHLVYDSEYQVVECQDCNTLIGPWKAFMMLVGNYNAAMSELHHRATELAELEAKSGKGLLKAVKEIERVWRGNMLPCCPHCGQAIAPEDGLTRSCVNKKMEMERRKFRLMGNATVAATRQGEDAGRG